MTEIVNDEIADANNNLPTALSSVAPVLGKVAAFYKSKFNEKLHNEYSVTLVNMCMQHSL